MARFNIDNSLMKQLFVVDKPEQELAKLAADGEPTNEPLLQASIPNSAASDSDKIIRALQEREVYNKDNSYDAWK